MKDDDFYECVWSSEDFIFLKDILFLLCFFDDADSSDEDT